MTYSDLAGHGERLSCHPRRRRRPAVHQPRRGGWIKSFSAAADPSSHPALIGRNHFALAHQIGEEGGFQAATERHGFRWTEVWLDGDNPDVDHVFDLGRLG